MSAAGGALELSVVIPTRNAAGILLPCLESVLAQRPREVIVVDGMSSDGTVELASSFGLTVLSDEGRGLPAARLLGAEAASSDRVALIDADVIVPDGALAALLAEFERGGYVALQAGLVSESSGEYWGEALADHHRNGRSRNWFGLVATVFDRRTLLEVGFDPTFTSGEDIEVRWRLERAGQRIGVSDSVVVRHRFEEGFRFAAGQFRADGAGLARMVDKHGVRALPLLGLPLAGAVRGIGLSLLRRRPRWIPYFAAYGVLNYVALFAELGRRRRSRPR